MNAAAAVLESIAGLLEERHHGFEHVGAVLALLAELEPISADEAPNAAPHHGELTAALAEMEAAGGLLARIARSVDEGAGELSWRVDDGRYYRKDAPVGDGYRRGNMHTVLGTRGDASAGLFLLRPGVDYRDHRHAAPELYVNLAGRPSWRFDGGVWAEMSPSSIVWNDAGSVHATRSGATPWLSFWCWTSDSGGWCEVVEYD